MKIKVLLPLMFPRIVQLRILNSNFNILSLYLFQKDGCRDVWLATASGSFKHMIINQVAGCGTPKKDVS